MILGKHSVAFRIIKWVALLLAIAFAGAAYYLTATCSGRRAPTEVVTPASTGPLVETLAGRSIALADIAPGKRVAIVVMKGTWCSVCTSQLTRLQERAAEIPDTAVVVALNADDVATNNEAAASLDLTMQILSDRDRDAIRAFGLDGPSHPIPGVVFLDEHGKVVDIVKGRYPGRPQEDWIIDRLR